MLASVRRFQEAERCEAAPKSPADWDANDDAFARDRVVEGKQCRVERQSVQAVLVAEQAIVLALAVTHVTNERTSEVLQMSADLVEPTRAGHRLHESVASRDREACEPGDGRDAWSVRLVLDGVVDDAVLRRTAARERQVMLLDPTFGERGAEDASRVGVQCKRHRTTRPSIETMERMHVPADDVPHRAHQVVLVVRPASMNG